MPLYGWTSEYQREDGRYICYMPGLGNKYKSRLVYCNYHNLTLEDIEGFLVHHKDEDRSNDSPDNLELVDHQRHSDMHPGRAKGNRSDIIKKKFSGIQKHLWRKGFYKNRKKKIKHKHEHMVNEVLEMYDKGKTKLIISRELGIPRTSIYGIIEEKRGE